MEKFITTSAGQTRKMGEMLAKELKGGEIVCLEGELGSGKTTFAQGILKGLKVEGPYTSPTFVIMKKYNKKQEARSKKQATNQDLKLKKDNSSPIIHNTNNTKYIIHIYHIDAYRVGSKDILELGWEEIVKNKNNVIIIEWADRIKKIIPDDAIWMKFEWMDKDKRKITISNKK